MPIHATRHTYASLAIAARLSLKRIQVSLGHSSVKMTMDVYGHLMDLASEDPGKEIERVVYEPTMRQRPAQEAMSAFASI